MLKKENKIQVLEGAYVSLQDLISTRYRVSNHQEEKTTLMAGVQSGIKLSKHNGRGIEFSEVRTYQAGDDVRSIDWRVTARKNRPHTKIFHEEREQPTIVAIDQSQNMFFGSEIRLKSVAAAEIAARIAWHTLRIGDRVGGFVKTNMGYQLHKPKRSQQSLAQLLNSISTSNQALDRKTQNTQNTFLEDLVNLKRLAKNRYRIYLLTDFSGDIEKWNETIGKLSRSNYVTCVHVVDPLEKTLPEAGHYSVTDGKTRIQFFTGNKKTLNNYRNQFLRKCELLQNACSSHGARYLKVETNQENLSSVRLY